MSFITRRSLRSPAILLIFIACAAAQTCYYPDGRTISNDIPCDPTAASSSCCGAESFCLADGLCYGNGLVTRGSCTDRTWADPSCATVCTNVGRSAEIAISPCTSSGTTNVFACGANTTACSSSTSTFTLSSSAALILRPNQIAQLVGSAIQTAAPTSFANSDATFTASTLVGVAVGIAVPFAIALVIMYILLRREKRRFSKPRLMYKLPDEVTQDDFTFTPPPPIRPTYQRSNPSFTSDRSSRSTNATNATATSTIASRRASRHTAGTGGSSTPRLAGPLSSMSFMERYEAMKKNSQAQAQAAGRDGAMSPGISSMGMQSPGSGSPRLIDATGSRHELGSPRLVDVSTPPPLRRHELESPSKEVLRYELSENRMSR